MHRKVVPISVAVNTMAFSESGSWKSRPLAWSKEMTETSRGRKGLENFTSVLSVFVLAWSDIPSLDGGLNLGKLVFWDCRCLKSSCFTLFFTFSSSLWICGLWTQCGPSLSLSSDVLLEYCANGFAASRWLGQAVGSNFMGLHRDERQRQLGNHLAQIIAVESRKLYIYYISISFKVQLPENQQNLGVKIYMCCVVLQCVASFCCHANVHLNPYAARWT